ncbi:MAG: hypothetical protein WC506_02675 [Candidatus Micrarchaeia archaeon]
MIRRHGWVFLFAIAALVLASAFLAGCNTSYSECCPAGAGACQVTLDNIKYNLTCNAAGQCLNGSTLMLTCKNDSAYCKNSSNMDSPVLVCENPTSLQCVKNMCNAMVCGYTKYDPAPVMSVQDQYSSSTASSDKKAGTVDSTLSSKVAVNLLGTSCQFKPLNQKTADEIKSAKGSLWLNSFRFGVGESFSDFEEARYYFPITDRQCGSPTGTKDRFTNYVGMKGAEGTCNIYGLGEYSISTCTTNGLSFYSYNAYDNGMDYLAACKFYCAPINDSMCSSTSRQSTTDKIPFLSSSASYNFTSAKYWAQAQCGEDGKSECSNSYGTCKNPWEGACNGGGDVGWSGLGDNAAAPNGGLLSSSTELYYRQILDTLKSEYNYEYYNGYEDIYGNHRIGPPYACEFDSECYSGTCNKNGYASLSVCSKSENTVQSNCQCYLDNQYRVTCSGNSAPASSLLIKPFLANGMVSPSDPLTFEVYKVRAKYSGMGFPTNTPLSELKTAPTVAELTPLIGVISNCSISGVSVSSTPRKQCDDTTSVRCYDGDNEWRSYTAVYAYTVTIGNYGTCDTDTGKLRVHTLGVCEACTTATVTQQDVTARSAKPTSSQGGMYCPIAVSSDNYPVSPDMYWEYYTKSPGLTRAVPICKLSEWDRCGGHSEGDKSCDCSGDDAGKYGCYDNFEWPYVTPVPQYLRDKLDIYLRSNVLPILNMQDANLWYSPYVYGLSNSGWFFSFVRNYDNTKLTADLFAKKDLPENMGAMIVNVGIPNGNSPSSGNYASNSDIIRRAKGVKEYCPRCLVAVENPDRSISRLDDLFDYDPTTKKTYNESAALVDLVLNSFNPSAVTAADPSLCGNYSGILNVQENYSRNLLERYQKPSIVNRFDINESAIQDDVAGYTDPIYIMKWGNGGIPNYGPFSITLNSGGTVIGTGYVSSSDYAYCAGSFKSGRLSIYFDSNVVGTINAASLSTQSVNDQSQVELNSQWWKCNWNHCDDGTGPDCNYGTGGPSLEGFGNYRSLWYNYHDLNNNGGQYYVRLYVNYSPSVSSQCWSQANMEGMMSYMFNQTSGMVNSGTLAIIYDKWRTNWTTQADGRGLVLNRGTQPDSKEAKFCSFQTNSIKALGLSTYTYFEKTYPKDSCECQPCTDYEKALGKCNPLCATGKQCSNTMGLASGTFKCPANCYMASDCKLCNATAGSVSCTFKYDDGSSATRSFDRSDLTSSLYGDVISAMPDSSRCCIQEEQQDGSLLNYTFVKTEVQKQKNTLDVYPRDGNQLVDCGTDPTSLDPTACGFSLPLSKAKITCN